MTGVSGNQEDTVSAILATGGDRYGALAEALSLHGMSAWPDVAEMVRAEFRKDASACEMINGARSDSSLLGASVRQVAKLFGCERASEALDGATGLRVPMDLNLSSMGLTALPDSLTVDGNLYSHR
jgi:hypothetical protein